MNALPSIDRNEVNRARGTIDLFSREDGEITIGGWVLHPTRPLESVVVHLDGARIGECVLHQREDLAMTFPHLIHAGCAGFVVRGKTPDLPRPIITLSVDASVNGRTVASFLSRQRADKCTRPLPPETLRLRVTGSSAPEAYTQIGLDAAVDLMNAVERHAATCNERTILDWGCGPGRITSALSEIFPHFEISGCDIDAEAIAWCNQHLRAGAFHATKVEPPLPFRAESFDIVLACSVMSHLASSTQQQWLAEIRRILRPGGLFVASVHGRFAAAFTPGLLEQLDRAGIVAGRENKRFRGIAPRGYYRGVFQTPSFVREYWSRELEVVEIIEAGLAGWQDLIVLRRRN